MSHRTIRLTSDEFAALLEYSCTLPTLSGREDIDIGKRWKRNLNWGLSERPNWWMGEYVDIGRDDKIGIEWTEIEIFDPPFPK